MTVFSNSCPNDQYCSKSDTGSCKPCGAGLGRCNSFGNIGSEADCSTNLNTNNAHCGVCFHACKSGETCVSGVCKCGTNDACPSTKVCTTDSNSNKVCTDCSTVTGGDECAAATYGSQTTQKYCTAAKDCGTCDAGKADCTTSSSLGGLDTGLSTDCETDLTLSGKTSNCGQCGLATPLHTALTCCSGKTKCGKFANTTNPSDADCAAAKVCGFDEYCEESLAMCVKMKDSLTGTYGNCKGYATGPKPGVGLYMDTLNTAQYCTSCNQTISQAALVNGSCLAFDHENCGAVGHNCSATQVCYKGKCLCSSGMVFSSLNYDAFAEVNPDKNQVYAAAKGCTYYDNKLRVNGGWNIKVTNAVVGFLTCASLTRAATTTPTTTKEALRSFTFASVSTPDVQQMACPGGANLCNSTFCAALVANMTAFKKPFCDSLVNVLPYYAYCGQKFVYPLDPPTTDPTCASTEVMQTIMLDSFTNWGDAHNAIFLGCPGLEDITKDAIASYTGIISNFDAGARKLGTLGGTYFAAAFNSGMTLSMNVGLMVGVVGGVVGMIMG
jgi:hypothetical protein